MGTNLGSLGTTGPKEQILTFVKYEKKNLDKKVRHKCARVQIFSMQLLSYILWLRGQDERTVDEYKPEFYKNKLREMKALTVNRVITIAPK